jgi:hypothetical protein
MNGSYPHIRAGDAGPIVLRSSKFRYFLAIFSAGSIRNIAFPY